MEGCCEDTDCPEPANGLAAFCQAQGYDAQNAYCGGMAPPEWNVCAADGCADNSDCAEGQACMPAGAFGYVLATCVRTPCTIDADCAARAGGQCLPFFRRCEAYGWACTYDDDPCRTDADCPVGERNPMFCQPLNDGQGTRCAEDIPRP